MACMAPPDTHCLAGKPGHYVALFQYEDHIIYFTDVHRLNKISFIHEWMKCIKMYTMNDYDLLGFFCNRLDTIQTKRKMWHSQINAMLKLRNMSKNVIF